MKYTAPQVDSVYKTTPYELLSDEKLYTWQPKKSGLIFSRYLGKVYAHQPATREEVFEAINNIKGLLNLD